MHAVRALLHTAGASALQPGETPDAEPCNAEAATASLPGLAKSCTGGNPAQQQNHNYQFLNCNACLALVKTRWP